MILDTPIITELAGGAGRIIPQDGDAQIYVPPALQPVTEILRPHSVLLSLTVPQVLSFISETAVSRTNQAQATFTMGLLGPGLWDLEITLATWFNFASVAAGFNHVTVQFVIGALTTRMLAQFAVIGAQTNRTKQRLLLRDNCTVQLNTTITGVGQSLDTLASLNAVRIL